MTVYKKGTFSRYILNNHPDPDNLLSTETHSVFDQMLLLANKWHEKVIKDRLNHLKSELSQHKNKKMDKSNYYEQITLLEARIDELQKLLKI